MSLSYLHNETLNVYSHLAGLVLLFPFIFILFYFGMPAVKSTLIYDVLAFWSFLIGLIACLLCSTIFHLFTCHSEEVSHCCNKFDYVGIVFLEVGSFIATIYYGFYCDNFYRQLYISSILLIGGLTIYIMISPKYSLQKYKNLRALIFTLLGCLGIIPGLHHILKYGIKMSFDSFALPYLLLMAFFYLFGVFVYTAFIPERWSPGKFDIIGHSHQIWHVCVLAAASFHFWGLYRMYLWWHNNNSDCSISDHLMISRYN